MNENIKQDLNKEKFQKQMLAREVDLDFSIHACRSSSSRNNCRWCGERIPLWGNLSLRLTFLLELKEEKINVILPLACWWCGRIFIQNNFYFMIRLGLGFSNSKVTYFCMYFSFIIIHDFVVFIYLCLFLGSIWLFSKNNTEVLTIETDMLISHLCHYFRDLFNKPQRFCSINMVLLQNAEGYQLWARPSSIIGKYKVSLVLKCIYFKEDEPTWVSKSKFYLGCVVLSGFSWLTSSSLSWVRHAKYHGRMLA